MSCEDEVVGSTPADATEALAMRMAPNEAKTDVSFILLEIYGVAQVIYGQEIVQSDSDDGSGHLKVQREILIF